MTVYLPWIFTATAISLTAIGHIFYKIYALNQRLTFLILTAITFVLIPCFSFLALRELTIAQVYLCTAMVPILTTIGAKVFIKEKITKHHISGLSLITVGTILYLFNSL